jgi:branched-chain amino acid transport system permease protein
VAAFGFLRKLWVSYLGLAICALIILAGAGAMIEMVYHLQLNVALGSQLKFLGMPLDAKGINSWFGAGFVLVTGLGLFELARRQFAKEWSQIQEDIEKEIKRREAAL